MTAPPRRYHGTADITDPYAAPSITCTPSTLLDPSGYQRGQRARPAVEAWTQSRHPHEHDPNSRDPASRATQRQTWLDPQALLRHILTRHVIPHIDQALASQHLPAASPHTNHKPPGTSPISIITHLTTITRDAGINSAMVDVITALEPVTITSEDVTAAADNLFLLDQRIHSAAGLDTAATALTTWSTFDYNGKLTLGRRDDVTRFLTRVADIDPEMVASGYVNERLHALPAPTPGTTDFERVIEDLTAVWLD